MVLPQTLILALCWLMPVQASIGSDTPDTIPRRHKVPLNEAHIGSLEIDTRLLDSYGLLPDHIRSFYLAARTVLAHDLLADFTHPAILEKAREFGITLMGGPMLGDLQQDGVTIWLRPSGHDTLVLQLKDEQGTLVQAHDIKPDTPGRDLRLSVRGLEPERSYNYALYQRGDSIAGGQFATAPTAGAHSRFVMTFGSCFHKIGLHHPNLSAQILARKPHLMMILGDIAVDDRRDRLNMHRSDYQLRDVSGPWRQLAANVPLYTSWDDHDYLDNDLGGVVECFTDQDRDALRELWQQNWNNPKSIRPGIYFNARVGPAELIMLDTRSLRDNGQRGEYGSYLGIQQLSWLKETLKNSTAPYKIISSGTMWSDYVTNGKDSWGTWDTLAREDLFRFIESNHISGVILISGDRHGARAFTIPRPSGTKLYEFEVATLGGVPGPAAMAPDPTQQLFGYEGQDFFAFGEFAFDLTQGQPVMTFRLINEWGTILEEHTLPYSEFVQEQGSHD